MELKLVEQRYRAVIDVLDGMSATDVARRDGDHWRPPVVTESPRRADGARAYYLPMSSGAAFRYRSDCS